MQRKSKWLGRRNVSYNLKKHEKELYDLENDPDEVINLAGEARDSSVLEELKSKLTKMREQTNDPWLILENQRLNREFYDKKFTK